MTPEPGMDGLSLFCREKGIERLTDKEIARFWSHVDRTVPDACWSWRGAKGYAFFAFRYRTFRATRVAFWIANGRFAVGLVRHACDRPPCVNPTHLVEGDDHDNIADRRLRQGLMRAPAIVTARAAHGSWRGTRNPNASLTEAQVLEIRRLWTEKKTARQIIRHLGLTVCPTTVHGVANRRGWRHVMDPEPITPTTPAGDASGERGR